MASRPVGSLIGAIAGLAFVLANAGVVPLSLLWSIVAAIAFAAISWFVVLRGPEADWPPPSRTALRTYAISVAAMIVAIPVGATIISNVLGKPNAVPVWVVFVVGAHFQPFAEAFQMPVFRWLSWALVVDAIVGGGSRAVLRQCCGSRLDRSRGRVPATGLLRSRATSDRGHRDTAPLTLVLGLKSGHRDLAAVTPQALRSRRAVANQ
jgi:hypothetical protein